ncbi:MAG: tyrosine recombinase [Bacteroidales bacterium]|nr:tyrosine recombinase [Bacteroidales bacterium]
MDVGTGTQGQEVVITWSRYLRQFKLYLKLERRMADNTVESYVRDVTHLQRYAIEQGVMPRDVTLDFLRDFLTAFNEADVAATTQKRIIAGIRSFYQQLVIEDDIKENPAELLETPTIPSHLPDVLTDGDVDAIQSTFDLSLPDQARNATIVEVLYGCGLRVSELCNLRLSNLFVDEEALHVVGKGDKERWVPINEHALKMLTTYIFTIRSQIAPMPGEDVYIFLSRRGKHLTRQFVNKFLHEAVMKAGIHKHVSPHSLRHTFATELVQNGADLRAVQVMLGHASISTTEIYTHLTPEYIRETIECYHPHYKKK